MFHFHRNMFFLPHSFPVVFGLRKWTFWRLTLSVSVFELRMPLRLVKHTSGCVCISRTVWGRWEGLHWMWGAQSFVGWSTELNQKEKTAMSQHSSFPASWLQLQCNQHLPAAVTSLLRWTVSPNCALPDFFCLAILSDNLSEQLESNIHILHAKWR